jgi:hypothetical protein
MVVIAAIAHARKEQEDVTSCDSDDPTNYDHLRIIRQRQKELERVVLKDRKAEQAADARDAERDRIRLALISQGKVLRGRANVKRLLSVDSNRLGVVQPIGFDISPVIVEEDACDGESDTGSNVDDTGDLALGRKRSERIKPHRATEIIDLGEFQAEADAMARARRTDGTGAFDDIVSADDSRNASGDDYTESYDDGSASEKGDATVVCSSASEDGDDALLEHRDAVPTTAFASLRDNTDGDMAHNLRRTTVVRVVNRNRKRLSHVKRQNDRGEMASNMFAPLIPVRSVGHGAPVVRISSFGNPKGMLPRMKNMPGPIATTTIVGMQQSPAHMQRTAASMRVISNHADTTTSSIISNIVGKTALDVETKERTFERQDTGLRAVTQSLLVTVPVVRTSSVEKTANELKAAETAIKKRSAASMRVISQVAGATAAGFGTSSVGKTANELKAAETAIEKRSAASMRVISQVAGATAACIPTSTMERDDSDGDEDSSDSCLSIALSDSDQCEGGDELSDLDDVTLHQFDIDEAEENIDKRTKEVMHHAMDAIEFKTVMQRSKKYAAIWKAKALN